MDRSSTTVSSRYPRRSDGGYARAFQEVVLPLVRAAVPGSILVSAGHDPHHADPPGGMGPTAPGFGPA